MTTSAATVAATGAVVLPTWARPGSMEQLGVVGWLRDRIGRPPVRADRTRSLVGERGGRLDRLDLWILVVLVLATMGMRTFRLAEPYQMHFDEVYHARTAAEFLQSWRYGLSHNIYEWTHPHVAKYLMAAGMAAWGEDDVSGTSELGVPVTAAVYEPRRVGLTAEEPAGERIHIATGGELRTYDARTRALIDRLDAPGATALAIDANGGRLYVGSEDGRISAVDLESIGMDSGSDDAPPMLEIGRADHPISYLYATSDGEGLVAASDVRVTTIDPASGEVTGTVDLPGIAGLGAGGTGPAVVAVPASVADPAALAEELALLTGGDASSYEDRLLGAVDQEAQVVLEDPGDEKKRTSIEEAITDGRLEGAEIVDLPRVAIATADGVSFLDPATAGITSTVEMDGGAHGLAMVVGIDDPKLYVTTGTVDDPAYEVVGVGGDDAADGPSSLGRHPLAAPGTLVAFDEASQQVHILGQRPDAREQSSATGETGGPWTVYVVEPHGNAVYADARLPESMTPAAWVMDVEPAQPAEDRQELLVFGADGATAAVEVGSHAFAWRLPGVIAGALMAACLYLLARILFARRLVAGLAALFVALEGMLFVQSRIGMNDVYVGLFILAAYTIFAAIWTGWWRGRTAFWVAMPVIGVLLGLALASKWVAAYAIGALILLLLVRSALGRVVAILGLIAITSVLGYLAISVPEGQGIGNLAFLLIMVGLTLLAVIVTILHPIAWSDEEMRFAVIAPAALGALVFFAALALGALDTTLTFASISITPFVAASTLAAGSLVVYGAFVVGGAVGFGPLAAAPGASDASRLPEPPAPAPEGWLRPGALAGLPVIWAGLALAVIPLVVYVVTYVPWALVEDHQLWTGFPAGHVGQTLLDLTGQMYGYHNGLTSPHPASSPWWAWPFDLKPVWFYQDGLGEGTTAAIYGAGNLVIWWFGALAMLFAAVMAFRRRSLALALITIGFAAQWIPWARIDRAAFQYHYFTALPFVVLALAYFVAELWNGPSRRTWAVARVAGAVAIVAPAAMWLASRPLCWFVGVETVNPGSAACPAVIPDVVVTVRTIGLLVVVGVGAFLFARTVLDLQGDPDVEGNGGGTSVQRLALVAVAVAAGFAAAAFLPDTAVMTWNGIPVEPIALVVALPLGYFAIAVLASRDARRYVVGLLAAVTAWFVVVYPNISALPLPSAVVNAYQGLLPTYLYAFQFPVSTADRTVVAPLLSPTFAMLFIAISVTCLVVAYSAWVWRMALADSTAARAGSTGSGSSSDGAGGLARTGGGA